MRKQLLMPRTESQEVSEANCDAKHPDGVADRGSGLDDWQCEAGVQIGFLTDDYPQDGPADYPIYSGKTGNERRAVKVTRLMLWTAPTLRHRGAIGWLR
jgi:hypothetical protein